MDYGHVSRLGVGGSILLYALRQWIWCFSAGHHPPACVCASLVRAGCSGLPGTLLSLLRLLRGSADRPLYFNSPTEPTLTEAELLLLQAVAAAIRRDRQRMDALSARFIGRDEVAVEAAALLQRVGRTLRSAGLQVWSDTALRRSTGRGGQRCEFLAAATPGSRLAAQARA